MFAFNTMMITSGGDPYWNSVHALAKMEDGDASTTVADEASGTWVVYGSLSEVTTDQAKFGTGSFLTNGVGASLRLSNPPALTGDFTIEFWGAPVQVHQTSGRLFQSANGDVFTGMSTVVATTAENSNLVYYSSSNGSSFNINSGTTILTAPTSDQFYHFVYMRSGSTLYVLVEGVQKVADTYTGTILIGADFIFGGQFSGTSRNCGYAIDEIRITNGVARYNPAGFTPPSVEFPTS